MICWEASRIEAIEQNNGIDLTEFVNRKKSINQSDFSLQINRLYTLSFRFSRFLYLASLSCIQCCSALLFVPINSSHQSCTAKIKVWPPRRIFMQKTSNDFKVFVVLSLTHESRCSSRLNLYIYEYLYHIGASKAAQGFCADVSLSSLPFHLRAHADRVWMCSDEMGTEQDVTWRSTWLSIQLVVVRNSSSLLSHWKDNDRVALACFGTCTVPHRSVETSILIRKKRKPFTIMYVWSRLLGFNLFVDLRRVSSIPAILRTACHLK